MQECERRRARRYMMQVPLAFRLPDLPNTSRCCGEILNISATGVCFSTHTPASRGTRLKVFLKLPKDVMGSPSPEWEWIGKVVYLRTLDHKAYEMGVEFLAYDLAPPREREE